MRNMLAASNNFSVSDWERVLDLWFGALDASGLADAAHAAQWWRKDPAFDESLRARFGADHAAAMAGERAEWTQTPRGRLALVIVLDQLSRNMFRDTPEMFAGDRAALRVAMEGIEIGHDQALQPDERAFLYMPLMHSEVLDHQDRCVALFAKLTDSVEGPVRARMARSLKAALQHREIVARFGRFPHRNTILGRTSSPEEQAFLKEPGSSF